MDAHVTVDCCNEARPYRGGLHRFQLDGFSRHVSSSSSSSYSLGSLSNAHPLISLSNIVYELTNIACCSQLASEGLVNADVITGQQQADKRGRHQGFCFRKTKSGRFLPYICWKGGKSINANFFHCVRIAYCVFVSYCCMRSDRSIWATSRVQVQRLKRLANKSTAARLPPARLLANILFTLVCVAYGPRISYI